MDSSLADILEIARPTSVGDVFLTEGRVPYIREATQLGEAGTTPVTRQVMEALFRECGIDVPDDGEPLDADAGFSLPDGLRFRANLHRRHGRLSAVLRHVRERIPNMEMLGLPEEMLTSWISRNSGLVLITGAVGSGKSTTIACCLEWLNHNSNSHIVTIEDPVEFVFSEQRSIFTQREVGRDTVSFARGLRSALRQSPDIIFVGEIRDRETAQIALQAAETGQLVISSLQSVGVRDTFFRLLNLFPSEDRNIFTHLLANQLIGVFCQQLLPAVDGGLFLALEYVEIEGAVRGWIREQDPERIEGFMKDRPNNHTYTFLEALAWGCREGKISVETAGDACSNRTELNRALRGVA